jgi:hypothetical protein|tara:strand:- start:762 stop:1100 length:339 start_codon:yes stop_codon:yes gene_type:complete
MSASTLSMCPPAHAAARASAASFDTADDMPAVRRGVARNDPGGALGLGNHGRTDTTTTAASGVLEIKEGRRCGKFLVLVLAAGPRRGKTRGRDAQIDRVSPHAARRSMRVVC